MNKQNKTSKGIKIIAMLMFVIGLIIFILSVGLLIGVVPPEGSEGYKIAFYVLAITWVIFISPLLIVGSIGLWKMRDGGVFLVFIAYGAAIIGSIVFLLTYVSLTN